MKKIDELKQADLLFNNISDHNSKRTAVLFVKDNFKSEIDYALDEISVLSKVSFWVLSLFITFLPFTMIISSSVTSKEISFSLGIIYLIALTFFNFKLSFYIAELFVEKRFKWFKKFQEIEKELNA